MIENVSTQLTLFHCFAHCLLPGRAFASLYVLLFLEKEAEIGGRVNATNLRKPVRNKPQHEISNIVVCATSKGSDQAAHTLVYVSIKYYMSPLNWHQT